MSAERVRVTLRGRRRWSLVGKVFGSEVLTPVCGVRCYRTAFEWPGLRVTLDRQVKLFAVEPRRPLELARQIGHLDGVVVEVKAEHQAPDWLQTALQGHEASRYSKSRYALALRDGLARPFLVVDS